jgi:hypothetical protein
MRVGLYVDGFNVYYGAREHCGRSKPGWRWLDLCSLGRDLIDPDLWTAAHIDRFTYCTAERTREGDASSLADQLVYIAALKAHGGATHTSVVLGKYAPRTKTGILVTPDRKPIRVVSPGSSHIAPWLPVREIIGASGATELLASISTFEEKGSDVNVASHLLIDVLTHQIDAAIVLSNDSDLEVPIKYARTLIPVGTVNPGAGATPVSLRGNSSDGVGRHWWRRLAKQDFKAHQLPDPIGQHVKPISW